MSIPWVSIAHLLGALTPTRHDVTSTVNSFQRSPLSLLVCPCDSHSVCQVWLPLSSRWHWASPLLTAKPQNTQVEWQSVLKRKGCLHPRLVAHSPRRMSKHNYFCKSPWPPNCFISCSNKPFTLQTFSDLPDSRAWVRVWGQSWGKVK